MNTKSAIIVVIITFVVGIFGIVVGWWLVTRENSSDRNLLDLPDFSQDEGREVSIDDNSQLEKTPDITMEESSYDSWQEYREDGQFEVKYPPGWHIVHKFSSDEALNPLSVYRGVSFGTGRYGNQGYDGELFIFTHDKSSMTVERKIHEMGRQFSDRQETLEHITINGTPALKVTVTTPSIPTWVNVAVTIEETERFYILSNGAVEKEEFEEFYKSFKLL